MSKGKRTGRGRDGYTVSPDKNGDWRLKRHHAERASGVFETQAAAAERGRELAKQARADLTIIGRDHRIRSKDSYGRDPLPPEDTER